MSKILQFDCFFLFSFEDVYSNLAINLPYKTLPINYLPRFIQQWLLDVWSSGHHSLFSITMMTNYLDCLDKCWTQKFSELLLRTWQCVSPLQVRKRRRAMKTRAHKSPYNRQQKSIKPEIGMQTPRTKVRRCENWWAVNCQSTICLDLSHHVSAHLLQDDPDSDNFPPIPDIKKMFTTKRFFLSFNDWQSHMMSRQSLRIVLMYWLVKVSFFASYHSNSPTAENPNLVNMIKDPRRKIRRLQTDKVVAVNSVNTAGCGQAIHT